MFLMRSQNRSEVLEKGRLSRVGFVVFAGLYYLLRLVLFYEGLVGNAEFENNPSALVEDIVVYSFLAIGVVGLLLLPGVYVHSRWAVLGTLVVSGYTMAFDVWASIGVQASAVAGIIPAAVIGGYLLLARKGTADPGEDVWTGRALNSL